MFGGGFKCLVLPPLTASFKDRFPKMFGCLSQVQSKTPKKSPASCNCMLENINEIVT